MKLKKTIQLLDKQDGGGALPSSGNTRPLSPALAGHHAAMGAGEKAGVATDKEIACSRFVCSLGIPSIHV